MSRGSPPTLLEGGDAEKMLDFGSKLLTTLKFIFNFLFLQYILVDNFEIYFLFFIFYFFSTYQLTTLKLISHFSTSMQLNDSEFLKLFLNFIQKNNFKSVNLSSLITISASIITQLELNGDITDEICDDQYFFVFGEQITKCFINTL